MEPNKKFIVAVVLAVVLAAVSIASWTQVSKLRQENSQLSSKVASAEDQSRQLQDAMSRLSSQLATPRSDYDALKAENERLKGRGSKKGHARAARR